MIDNIKKQRFTDEIVEAAIAEIFKNYKMIGKNYWRGLYNDNMACKEMSTGFHEIFMKLFSDNYLKLILTEANYPQFVREYENYRNGVTSFDVNLFILCASL